MGQGEGVITCVRIQWDPERDLHLQPLAHRAIQIGLGGVAVDRYVDDWTVAITDTTELMSAGPPTRPARRVGEGLRFSPRASYPISPRLAARIGAR